MTGSTIAGILVADMIFGRENPWAVAYDPRRKPPVSKTTLSSLGEVSSHTIQVWPALP